MVTDESRRALMSRLMQKYEGIDALLYAGTVSRKRMQDYFVMSTAETDAVLDSLSCEGIITTYNTTLFRTTSIGTNIIINHRRSLHNEQLRKFNLTGQ